VEIFLAVVALALLAVWFVLRKRRDTGPQKPDRRTSAAKTSGSTQYHAVSIRFEADACPAAKELQGRRFLSNEAPSLPLPECRAVTCRCHFMHHEDRRSGKDRRSPFGAGGLAGATGRYEKERRQQDDRRADDDFD